MSEFLDRIRRDLREDPYYTQNFANDGQRFLASDRIFAILVVIAVIGLAIDILLRVLRDRVGRWV